MSWDSLSVSRISTKLLAISLSIGLTTPLALAAAPAYWDPSGQQSSGSGNGSYYTPPADPANTTTQPYSAQPNPYAAPNMAPQQPPNPYANNPTLYASVSTVPAGTRMSSAVSSYLSSDSAQIGDPVTANLSSDVAVGGQVVLPAGTMLQGQVVSVTPGRRLSRYGQLQIRFNRAQTPDGRSYTLSGRVATQDGSGIIKAGTTGKTVGKAAKNTVGGAILGAGIGALTGLIAGKTSTGNRRWDDYAVRGAVWGGAAGLGKTAYDRGDDVQINPGTPMDVILDQPLSVTATSPGYDPYNPYNNTAPQSGYPQNSGYPAQPSNPSYNPY